VSFPMSSPFFIYLCLQEKFKFRGTSPFLQFMLSAVTSFFVVRITQWVVLILYFSPLRNSFLRAEELLLKH
jgi:hypothetical protein